MNSRRQFLVASSAAMAAAALPKSLFAERLGGDVFSNASLGAYTQGLLTQEHFEQVVGSTFTMFLDDAVAGRMTLMAVAATEGTTASNGPSNAPSRVSPRAQLIRPTPTPTPTPAATTSFYLTFNVNGPAFAEDTYLVDHGTLGRFAMFVVPGEPQHATATFNYLGDPRNWQSVTGPPREVPLKITPVQTTPVQTTSVQAIPAQTTPVQPPTLLPRRVGSAIVQMSTFRPE